jgi:hypothetical protein
MKNLEFKDTGVRLLTNSEIDQINGGFISRLDTPFRLLGKLVEIAIVEVADFAQGVKEGYGYVRK